MINYQQFASALRWVLTAAGVWLANKGVGDASLWTTVSGAVIALAPFVWSMIRHTKVGTIMAADELPEVAGVITRPTVAGAALASASTSDTVVPAGTGAAATVAART